MAAPDGLPRSCGFVGRQLEMEQPVAFGLTDVTVGDTGLNFVGLKNFERIVEAPQFQRALISTFIFALGSQLLIVVLATALAELLSQDFRGKGLVRFLIILPWETPVALTTLGWLWLLDSKLSPIDWVLQSVHLLGPCTLLGPEKHINFLGREWLAMASVITVHVWRMLPLAARTRISRRNTRGGDPGTLWLRR